MIKAPEEGQFRGYPTLNIVVGKKFKSDDDDVFIIGIKKAIAIVEWIDHIRRFVEKHEKKGGRGREEETPF